MSASRTLLEMTQEILLSMQSDEVTSITDTAESTAVANCIRRTYWDLFGLQDLPEHYTAFKLTATSSATPVLMTVPTNAFKVDWVKYNRETVDQTDDTFQKLTFLSWEEALDRSHKLVPSASNVASFSYSYNPLGSDTIGWYYQNDIAPTWYTSPDDYNLLFNSVDTGLETFLTASRTVAYGIIDPTFTFTDTFTPDLDVRQYSLLLNEAKSQAFVELKQTANAKADNRARRLMIKTQSEKARKRVPNATPLSRLPGYGRK